MKTSILALFLLAAAFAAWLLWPASSMHATAPVPSAAIDAAPPAHEAPAAAATPAEFARPVDDRPFSDMRAELERRAKAGDGPAAVRLAWVLERCNHYRPATEADIERGLVDAAALGDPLTDEDDNIRPLEEILRREKASHAQRDRDCRGATGVGEPYAIDHAFEWLRRAAELGDTDAQALYGGLVFRTMSPREAMANAQSLHDEKRRARDYAEHALAQGNALALRQMAVYRSEGVLYPADAEAAYAYLYAYSLTPRAAGDAPDALALLFEKAATALDAAAIDRARAEGQRLALCCTRPREAP